MSLLTAAALAGAGILLLYVGGELLVRGSVTLARIARVTPAVIGLTIVSIGTSLPELAVSLAAALKGNTDIAMGNVVGSNIFNVAVVAAIAALLLPITVRSTTVKVEWPFMFVMSGVAVFLAHNGIVGRLEGAIFLTTLVVFLFFIVRLARAETLPEPRRANAVARSGSAGRRTASGVAMSLGLTVLGIGVLVIGARLAVRGAVTIAQLVGVTERVIGLTIVAAGTSLPELAASVVAALRRESELALGNVIGSNIFNILGILGTVALVQPVAVAAKITSMDMWWMLGYSLALLPLMFTQRRTGRLESAALLGGYVVYLWILL